MPHSGEKEQRQQVRSWSKAALVLLVGAVLLRLAVVLATRDDLVFRVPYLDAAFYHFWAVSLATDAGDFRDAYFLGPLYPHVLSWLYRLGGADILTVRLLQTLLGCLDLLLVLKLASRLHCPSSGWFAALLLAFQGTVFFYEGILVMESLMTTLVLGAAFLLLLPAATGSSRVVGVLIAGALLGAATAGRGTVLLLLPVSFWWLWKPLHLQNTPVADTARQVDPRVLALCLILAWAAPLLPVWQHNRAHGAPWTLTTNAGVNFYAGNHEGCRGRFRSPPGIEFFQAMVDLPAPEAGASGGMVAPPPALAERALTTRAVAASDRAADSAYWFREAAAWIRSHPVDFGALLIRKAVLVLQNREIGQIESPSFHRQRLPLLRIFWVDWGLLVSLAAVGLWGGLRQAHARPLTLRLVVLMTTLLLPCVLFFVTARYRLVAVPVVCLLAGMGVTTLLSARRQRRQLWVPLLLLVGVFVLTRLGGHPTPAQMAWENAQMAERFYATGQLGDAIALQEAAHRLQPRRMEIQLNLALYLSERGAPGDVATAEQMVRELVGRFPDRPVLLFNWASLLEQSGDVDAARRAYLRVLELDPSFEAARHNLDALERR